MDDDRHPQEVKKISSEFSIEIIYPVIYSHGANYPELDRIQANQ